MFKNCTCWKQRTERRLLLKSSKKENKISIRSSAAEYLAYVAAVGDDKDSDRS